MLQILLAETNKYKNDIRELFFENLSATNLLIEREFNIKYDVDAFLAQDLANLGQFSPPTGRFLLAEIAGAIAGCAALRELDANTGEVKRMYVRSPFRRQGIGRALLYAIIDQAQQIGYTKLRLDAAPFAQAAQQLYASAGFVAIAPYPESEIPQEYHQVWKFMELIIK